MKCKAPIKRGGSLKYRLNSNKYKDYSSKIFEVIFKRGTKSISQVKTDVGHKESNKCKYLYTIEGIGNWNKSKRKSGYDSIYTGNKSK